MSGHGFLNGFFGSFGWVVVCICGGYFNDYDFEDEEPTPWARHQAQYKAGEGQ